MHSFHYQQGRLHCEEVDLETVANAHGTPLYIYSATTILDHYRRLAAALRALAPQIFSAVEANSKGAILRLFGE
ncbi:MAG: diaminopimelate decarboxylase, partial [Chthoniobacterales bacterium]